MSGGPPKSSKSGRSKRNRSLGSNGFSDGSPSRTGAGAKSSMIDKERAQLEKIKARQQKEIEAMMEQERRNEEIQEKNR